MPEDLLTSDQSPHRTQRLGSYAVATRIGRDGAEEILLTRISTTGFPAGWWTLPGGGVDHGESPNVAVERELYEETGLAATASQLVAVHDIHIVDQGRDDMYEDYHGVHLLYRVAVDPDATPHVVEVGGSTDLAMWVRVEAVGVADDHSPILPMVQYVLDRIDQYR